jgi:uncharacterized membrane protein
MTFDDSKHGPDLRESKTFLTIIAFLVVGVVSLVAIASDYIFKIHQTHAFEGMLGETAFLLFCLWSTAAILVLKLLAPVEHIILGKIQRGEYKTEREKAEDEIQKIRDRIEKMDSP